VRRRRYCTSSTTRIPTLRMYHAVPRSPASCRRRRIRRPDSSNPALPSAQPQTRQKPQRSVSLPILHRGAAARALPLRPLVQPCAPGHGAGCEGRRMGAPQDWWDVPSGAGTASSAVELLHSRDSPSGCRGRRAMGACARSASPQLGRRSGQQLVGWRTGKAEGTLKGHACTSLRCSALLLIFLLLAGCASPASSCDHGQSLLLFFLLRLHLLLASPASWGTPCCSDCVGYRQESALLLWEYQLETGLLDPP
jgi:hypothetical protein